MSRSWYGHHTTERGEDRVARYYFEPASTNYASGHKDVP